MSRIPNGEQLWQAQLKHRLDPFHQQDITVITYKFIFNRCGKFRVVLIDGVMVVIEVM